MHLTDSQKRKIARLVLDYIATAQNNLSYKGPVPVIKYFQSGATAGFAGRTRVRFNEPMAAQNWEEFQDCPDCTVGHEVAHVITFALYPGAKGHGREWQHVMRTLGLNPSRTHSLDTTGIKIRREKRHAWTCGCTVWNVTTRKHKRMMVLHRAASNAGWRCQKCMNLYAPKNTQPKPQPVPDWRQCHDAPEQGFIFAPRMWSVETDGKKFRVRSQLDAYYLCDTMAEVETVIKKIKADHGARQVKQAARTNLAE